ncbi:MAG TPA: glycosyltransferase family 2 protein [Ignavibacteria bacterium]
MDKISIIIPVYFNELSLNETYNEVKRVMDENASRFDYELVLVDDGSKDNSYNVMKSLAAQDKKIRLVKLSKNHGSYVAILAGLSYATGDAYTFLAADLQDPPDLIPQMYDEWLKYNRRDMVFSVRSSREDPIISRIYAYFFYKLFRTFVLPEYPEKGYDCFFINKEQRDMVVKMNEKNSHLMAQIIWLGYGHHYIYYHRQRRRHGKSRWTFFKKFKLAFDTFFGFSGRPLRLASFLGMNVSVLGFILALYIIIRKIVSDAPVFGIPSLMVSILITGGLILMSIGIVGEYMWRNFDESRSRPTFIVEETQNC